jgi:alcohol dehydrogenase class IV
MLEAYEFAVPPLVRFGAGRIVEVGELAALYGRHVWLVAGGTSFKASGAADACAASFASRGLSWRQIATTSGEPTVDDVAAALASLPADSAGAVVVAIGGGATIDLAQAVAALATNLAPHELAGDAASLDAAIVDRLEGVGRGLPITEWPLPLVAVPTTAGTGSEATRNAVISCPRRRFKKSMRSPMMVPRAALLDPRLTLSCSRATTAAAGLDCITQLIEAFVCRFARPLPRALVLDALPRAIDALPRALDDPSDLAARAALSHAAFVSGMALANAGLGMAHGVAAALGIECGTPHGLACAVLLPVAVRVNRPVAGVDFARLERAVDPASSGNDSAAADAFVDRVARLCRTVGVPGRLADLGLRPDRIEWLAENSGGASMRGNPRELSVASLREILAAIA